jgi:hypothetical protein
MPYLPESWEDWIAKRLIVLAIFGIILWYIPNILMLIILCVLLLWLWHKLLSIFFDNLVYFFYVYLEKEYKNDVKNMTNSFSSSGRVIGVRVSKIFKNSYPRFADCLLSFIEKFYIFGCWCLIYMYIAMISIVFICATMLLLYGLWFVLFDAIYFLTDGWPYYRDI